MLLLTSYLNTPSHRSNFSVSVSFTLRVLTPPPILHPETEMYHSLHPIFQLCSGLGLSGQISFHLAGPHRLFCFCCLAALNVLPRSLSSHEAPLHEPVSAISSPVRSLPSTLLEPLSTLVGYPFLVPSFLRQFSNHSPPTGLDRRPGPFWYQGGLCLQSWSPILLRRASCSPAPVPPFS